MNLPGVGSSQVRAWGRRRRPGAGHREPRQFYGRLEVLEARDLLAVVVGPIPAIEGASFTGRVATFAPSDIAGPPADAVATIAWGDGIASPGTIRPVSGNPDLFEVVGTKLYAQDGPYLVSVTVRGAGGSTASGVGNAAVAAAPFSPSGTVLTATAGQPFSGVVARFSDANPLESSADFVATIAWGDGSTDVGTIQRTERGEFLVTGSHLYSTTGEKAVDVRIVEMGGQDQLVRSQVVVVQHALTAIGTTVTPTAGQPFTGVVARFFDARPGASPGDYRAVIRWGDGRTDAGLIRASGTSGFEVVGRHTYRASADQTITVEVTRALDGQTATATSRAVVVGGPLFSIRIDALSDSGASNSDGVTNVPIPTFTGTAEPFAIVNLLARQPGQTTALSLGQTVADEAGRWRLTSIALSDGRYVITGVELAPTRFPNVRVADYPDGRIVIDMVAPRVGSLAYNPSSGRAAVTFVDSRSGLGSGITMFAAGAGNPANYAILGPRPAPRIRGFAAAPLVPNDPRVVAASFRVIPAVQRRSYQLRVLSGGVADLAGNALDGEFRGTFPSGNGRAGGVFLAPLLAGRVTPPRRRR